jgi:hypothetical protein
MEDRRLLVPSPANSTFWSLELNHFGVDLLGSAPDDQPEPPHFALLLEVARVHAGFILGFPRAPN